MIVSTRLTRAQLLDVVGDYRDALGRADATQLATASGLRFTENGQDLRLGEGLWATCSGPLPDPQVSFADPLRQTAGFIGMAHEHGRPVAVAVVITVDDGLISGIESLVVRPGAWVHGPEGMTPRARADRFEPTDRDVLVGAAAEYFDAIARSDAARIPIHDDALRIENGVQVVLTEPPLFASAPVEQLVMASTVAGQIDLGIFDFVTRVRERRHLVVDEEAGVICSAAVFDQPAVATSVEIRGVGRVDAPPTFQSPCSVFVVEGFVVRDGRIETVAAVLDFLPLGFRSGWGIAGDEAPSSVHIAKEHHRGADMAPSKGVTP